MPPGGEATTPPCHSMGIYHNIFSIYIYIKTAYTEVHMPTNQIHELHNTQFEQIEISYLKQSSEARLVYTDIRRSLTSLHGEIHVRMKH